ncbi:unnamed protein product [Moneuplotes crassus]|uniref:EF-hand domain-containing protein n=1 Tax=Euplotes crassus TaxID=5936 RepID=A0AAD2D7M0_EUPCR|nr:unnamed protein product [Moneuplotes crassus]
MNNNVNTEERKLFKENFDSFDVNGDGRLDIKELATALRSVGFHLTQKDAEAIHAQADRDGSGYIEYAEFERLIVAHMKEPYTKDELIEAFNIFDENKSGKISAQELKNVCMQAGDKMKASELEEIIQEADINGDGELDISEFSNMLLSGQKHM